MNTSETPPQDNSMKRLIVVTNLRVAANLRPGNAYSGWLAALRSGITRSGEASAIRAAGPFLAGVREYHHRPLIRSAALRAVHKDVPHADKAATNSSGAATSRHLTVGGSFAPLRQADSESTDQLIAALPTVGMESAVEIFNSLISRCASQKRTIPVNFVALAMTLAYWGNGASSRSQNVRTRVVLDYFSTNSAE